MTTQEMYGIAHELGFWMWFTKTDRFLNNWWNSERNPELESFVQQLIKPGDRVLDVGSGPVSILKGTTDNLIACDPLGGLYALILDYSDHEMVIPVAAENLRDFYDENSFDVVHMRNAIDHSQNPKVAWETMKEVCKVGGRIIVHGFENEADHEKGQGFHRWNFTVREDLLICTSYNPDQRTLSQSRLVQSGGRGGVIPLNSGRNWFFYEYTKQ